MESRSVKRKKNSSYTLCGLPDDILSFTLSFLPIKEASRTSVLSSRWRNLWKDSVKFSSSLNLDVIGSEYDNKVLENKKLMSVERARFMKWVDQILQLDYGPLLDTFRLRFEMEKNFSRHIDKWISVAIAKKIQKFDISLSKFIYKTAPYDEWYKFPERLFNESGALVKCLYLHSCVLGPLDFKCFSSLNELKLNNVLVDQDIVAKFLAECPNLEKMWLLRCYKLGGLNISGSSLKLKDLTIITYECLSDVKINAKNLNKLDFQCASVKFSYVNAPALTNLALVSNRVNDGSDLHYVTSGLPKLETLFVVVKTLEEKRIPTPFPPYKNLKNLELKVVYPHQSLWELDPLLCASPALQVLKLHLYHSGPYLDSKICLGQRASCSPHLHLKEILITGFDGSNFVFNFLRYMLLICEALQTVTLDSTCKVYNPWDGLIDDNNTSLELSKIRKTMQDRAEELFMPFVPTGVQVIFM